MMTTEAARVAADLIAEHTAPAVAREALAVTTDEHGRPVPDLRAVLDRIAARWWADLTPRQRVAVVVHRATAASRASIADVLHAISLAGDPVDTPYPSVLTAGRVRVDEHGQWIAEAGAGGTLATIGAYGTLAAAEQAVTDTIGTHRDWLRQRLREQAEPLRRLADVEWDPPTVQVWATTEQRTRSASMDVVSMAEIARRAGVERATVDQWRRRHADFPPPLPSTTVRRWDEVAAWLQATGRAVASAEPTPA